MARYLGIDINQRLLIYIWLDEVIGKGKENDCNVIKAIDKGEMPIVFKKEGTIINSKICDHVQGIVNENIPADKCLEYEAK